MRLLRAFTIFLLVAPIATVSFAQRSPRNSQDNEFLDRVLKANRDLKCRGGRVVVRKYKRDGKLQTVTNREHILRDGIKSWTQYSGNEDIDGQIAIDDGVDRYHFFPGPKVIHKLPSIQQRNRLRLEDIIQQQRSQFEISVEDGPTVARYKTKLISLKAAKGYSHKIWVDSKDLAILKREMLFEDGVQGMTYEFRWFRYLDTVDPKEFKLDMPDVPILGPKEQFLEQAKKLKIRPFLLGEVGKFKLIEARGYDFKDRDGNSHIGLRSTYGDGRVLVTLVQTKNDIREDRITRGRLNAVIWKKNSYNLALIGDLPHPELKRLSNLVRQ